MFIRVRDVRGMLDESQIQPGAAVGFDIMSKNGERARSMWCCSETGAANSEGNAARRSSSLNS
jgi:hypothetical protein